MRLYARQSESAKAKRDLSQILRKVSVCESTMYCSRQLTYRDSFAVRRQSGSDTAAVTRFGAGGTSGVCGFPHWKHLRTPLNRKAGMQEVQERHGTELPMKNQDARKNLDSFSF